MQITVTTKDVYGQTLVYPVCERAKLFASMVGRKTLTHSDLCHIERLGYIIVQSGQPASLSNRIAA